MSLETCTFWLIYYRICTHAPPPAATDSKRDADRPQNCDSCTGWLTWLRNSHHDRKYASPEAVASADLNNIILVWVLCTIAETAKWHIDVTSDLDDQCADKIRPFGTAQANASSFIEPLGAWGLRISFVISFTTFVDWCLVMDEYVLSESWCMSEGCRGLMVKASGWRLFDRQFEPYLCALVRTLPLRPCGTAWDAVPEPMVEYIYLYFCMSGICRCWKIAQPPRSPCIDFQICFWMVMILVRNTDILVRGKSIPVSQNAGLSLRTVPPPPFLEVS